MSEERALVGKKLAVSLVVRARVLDLIQRSSVGGRCQMPVVRMAEELGYSATSAYRAIKRLEADGYLKLERSRNRTLPLTIKVLIERPGVAEQLAIMEEASLRLMNAELGDNQSINESDLRYQSLISNIRSVGSTSDDRYYYMLIEKTDDTEWVQQVLLSLGTS